MVLIPLKKWTLSKKNMLMTCAQGIAQAIAQAWFCLMQSLHEHKFLSNPVKTKESEISESELT